MLAPAVKTGCKHDLTAKMAGRKLGDMAKDLEIERKFLVKRLPSGLKRHSSSKIIQGYFPMGREDLEIRLRRKGAKHCITIKGGHGRSRLEEEIEVPKSRFRALWPLYGSGTNIEAAL